MLNLDSESGEIIWQRQLQTDEPVLIFDKEIMVVYDMNRVTAWAAVISLCLCLTAGPI